MPAKKLTDRAFFSRRSFNVIGLNLQAVATRI